MLVHSGDGDWNEVKYVTDEDVLRKPCRPCKTTTEGLVVGNRLLEILKENKDGVGLAANQVGVNTSVCVVNVTQPIILINPRLVGQFGKSFFQEACLSFPGDYVITERWTNIVVDTLNHKRQLIFSFEKNPLECVCVQHEIDHLNGITMLDRAIDKELFSV